MGSIVLLLVILISTGQMFTSAYPTCQSIGLCYDCAEAKCKFAYEFGETIKSTCVDLYEHKPGVHYAPSKDLCLDLGQKESSTRETSTNSLQPIKDTDMFNENPIQHPNSVGSSREEDYDAIYKFLKKMTTEECGIAFGAGIITSIVLILCLICIRAKFCKCDGRMKKRTRGHSRRHAMVISAPMDNYPSTNTPGTEKATENDPSLQERISISQVETEV